MSRFYLRIRRIFWGKTFGAARSEIYGEHDREDQQADGGDHGGFRAGGGRDDGADSAAEAEQRRKGDGEELGHGIHRAACAELCHDRGGQIYDGDDGQDDRGDGEQEGEDKSFFHGGLHMYIFPRAADGTRPSAARDG